jgi:hypothetical protein
MTGDIFDVACHQAIDSSTAPSPNLVPSSIERDSKGVYTIPAFELKSGSKGNDALLPTEWRGVMQGLQQVQRISSLSLSSVDLNIHSRGSCSQF